MTGLKAATLLGYLLPVANALVGIDWEASSTLTDITFPLNMAAAAHVSGFYFAQQFEFEGGSDVGYIGLQPREDYSNGSPDIHAAFSSFIPGTTSDDPTCSDGADGGAGLSCAFDWSASYDDTYDMVVESVGGSSWKGTAVNTVTGEEYHIGQYTLPSSYGNIKSSQGGFVEYYPWNTNAYTCDGLPYVSMSFGTPTSQSGGAVSLSKPYEYGDCAGEADFTTSEENNGWAVQVGF
jgi:hypothetical protein